MQGIQTFCKDSVKNTWRWDFKNSLQILQLLSTKANWTVLRRKAMSSKKHSKNSQAPAVGGNAEKNECKIDLIQNCSWAKTNADAWWLFCMLLNTLHRTAVGSELLQKRVGEICQVHFASSFNAALNTNTAFKYSSSAMCSAGV